MFTAESTTRARWALVVGALLASAALEAHAPELAEAGEGGRIEADLVAIEGERQAALELDRLAR